MQKERKREGIRKGGKEEGRKKEREGKERKEEAKRHFKHRKQERRHCKSSRYFAYAISFTYFVTIDKKVVN